MKHLNNWLRAAILGALLLTLSGCFLRFALSTVTVTDLGDFIDVQVDFVFNDVTGGVCLQDDFFTFRCAYGVLTEDGSVEVVSSTDLISEFGLFGVLIDPVIVQVPASAVVDRARVDDGATVQDLVVSETAAFNLAPGMTMSAEPGHKFLIFELPPAIEASLPEVDPQAGPQFDFDVGIGWQQTEALPSAGLALKVMYAGRVTAGGQTFYPLTFPCADNMIDVPAIILPVGGPFNVIFNILFHYFDHQDEACAGQVYDFTAAGPDAGPLQCDADLDADVDRDDIQTIVGLRNTPASGPDDALDRDGNGVINILDARACVLDCTLPRCARP